ncbi:biotin-dependent carboxyltransferase family protein [Hoyosella rhizosphaerae]|uniref:Allophanate hydrolase n=1 Tax=Hoyosella rhizosphaerae TaxID=1755582 RepID=A0A916XJ78_9ACTN|nr:biotin-dependent carboxyltransferase family protein [Hoyosella rhizosphaerae]MBN4928373.1 biotin-dependent carboxyltransferase family protein [Hoyosella rhizosphaerae]GGC74441.1 allophanate hydrolase [Hoyosella rhizosphaerae]
MTATLIVLTTGPFATIQDGGRPGHSADGVTWSGAADHGAFAAANRLVGNTERAPCVEITLGGFKAKATSTMLCAITGPTVPATINGTSHPANHSFVLNTGDVLSIGAPPAGCRNYLAVRGGFVAERTLGSCSTDTLSGLGPPVVKSGDHLCIGPSEGTLWPAATSLPHRWHPHRTAPLLVAASPRTTWFTPAAIRALTTTAYTVSTDSNRVGVRLNGHKLTRQRTDELPSEGMVPGAIQVPPDGQPVVFLRDHPVTGGYPVIGVVINVDAVAQLRPGDETHFRWS